MKKMILGFAIALFMFGCSNDDDEQSISKDELVGKWIWVSTESKMEILGQETSSIQEAEDYDFQSYIAFMADGNYEASGDPIGGEISYEKEITAGTYEVDGDEIIVTVDGMTISSKAEIENGNRLIMTYDQGVEGLKVVMVTTFTKE